MSGWGVHLTPFLWFSLFSILVFQCCGLISSWQGTSPGRTVTATSPLTCTCCCRLVRSPESASKGRAARRKLNLYTDLLCLKVDLCDFRLLKLTQTEMKLEHSKRMLKGDSKNSLNTLQNSRTQEHSQMLIWFPEEPRPFKLSYLSLEVWIF